MNLDALHKFIYIVFGYKCICIVTIPNHDHQIFKIQWSEKPGFNTRLSQKMVLDASLLNTQYYKVWIKGK